MRHYEHFWGITLVRGLLAIFVGCSVIVVPDMATTLLLLPFAVAFSVLGLAMYGILDSALVLIASFNTDDAWPRTAQRLQGFLGVTVGILMFTVVFDHMRLHWFFYLVSLQLGSMAISEFFVARHVSNRHGSRWLFSTALLATIASIGYLYAALHFGEQFSSRAIAWYLYGYLLSFGIAQCLIAASMLYMDLEPDVSLHHHRH